MTYLRLTPERLPSEADSGPQRDHSPEQDHQPEPDEANEIHRAAAARFERFERDRAAGEGMIDAPAPKRQPEDEDT